MVIGKDSTYLRKIENPEDTELEQDAEGQRYDPTFAQKLRDLGVSAEAIPLLEANGVTTPIIFARLLDSKALDLLFKKEGLNQLQVLVEQRVRVLHRWLRQCHDRGVNLNRIMLSRFTDKVMASCLDAKEAESTMKSRSGTTKDTGLTLPTFSGAQGVFKQFNDLLRAFLCQNKNEEGTPLIYVVI